MFRVKIYGAGSIGNHLAHASRRLGWNVTVCDLDPVALKRMKEEIYPTRYKQWDSAIRLCLNSDAPEGGFDLICIGTPPDHHLSLAVEALREQPRAILVEKPLCTPSLTQADECFQAVQNSSTKVFVGYDHVVGQAARYAERVISSGMIGEVQTIDVDFREHWGGIFDAHPWLNGPEDSYLGYWERGGGASGEHSHAINLWQHFARLSGAGRVNEVNAMLRYVTDGKAHFDDICLIDLRTEHGLAGRVVQDVITRPHRKRARIQGSEGAVEWVNGYNPEGDAVLCLIPGKNEEVQLIPKKRPDDFIEELKHLHHCLEQKDEASDIDLERGLDTMLVVAAVHESERNQCRMQIDFSRGYSLGALRRR